MRSASRARAALVGRAVALSSGANAGAKCGDDGLLIMLILADITDSDLLDRADGEEDMVRV